MVNRNPCSATIPAVFCYLCGCTTWLPDRFSPECEAVTTIFCVEIAATLAMHCAGQAAHWSGSQWPVAWPVARRLAAVMVSLCAEFQMVKILISLCLMRPGLEHFLYCKTASKCILCRVCRVQDSRTGSLWTCCLHILHKGVAGNGQIMPNHSLEEQNSAVRGATGSCKWVTFRAGWPTCLQLSRGGFSDFQTVPDTQFFVCGKSMADVCLLFSFVTCASWRVQCFNLTNPTLKTSAMKCNSFCESPGKSQNSEFGMHFFETSCRLMTDVSLVSLSRHRGLVLERKSPLGCTGAGSDSAGRAKRGPTRELCF